jgi:streptogramin lyase
MLYIQFIPFQENAPMHPAIREIGVPVHSVNWVHLYPGQNREGDPRIYAVMGQQATPLFLLQIDPETGAFRQFDADVSEANFPTATLMSRTGQFYIGSSYAGHLLRFDPQKDALEDLGPIHPEAAVFPCRLDEDANGRIWIGSYGTADLTCYDPGTDSFTRHGRMDEVDMYNYPLVAPDGKVACLIRVTHSRVVLFDPKTGEKTPIGPTAVQGEASLDLWRGADQQLYIESNLGNFRIEDSAAVPIDELPARASAPLLPDGSSFDFADAQDQGFRTLRIRTPQAEERLFDLDYRASGSSLFYIHLGLDECVYGSSVMPLHLFRYNPKDGELIDLGQCSTATGEAYSMANLDGRIYISSYPQAILSVYDPSQGYRFGDDPGANPRDLGRIDDLSYRPRTTLAGPLGRIWTASLPDYGRWSGPLSWYDPRNGEKKAYYEIAGDGSCYTLSWLPDRELIAVGTTIQGGSGTQPKASQATLFLWDYNREEKVWEGSPERPVTTVNGLLTGPDGRIYGSLLGGDEPALFVFDPEQREFIRFLQLPAGDPLDLGLQNGPDGRIYGFTSSCIYRLDPASLTVEELIHQEDAFQIAGPIVGDSILFAKVHRLMAARIF